MMEKIPASFYEKISVYENRDRQRIIRVLEQLRLQSGALTDIVLPAGETSSGIPSTGIASILIDLNLDADSIIAALLLENCREQDGSLLSAAQESPENATGKAADGAADNFGAQAVQLVRGLVKIGDISAKNKTIREAESVRNMLFAMIEDIRVILIKLAEKLHTLRNVEALPAEERKTVAQECLDIYAPLADRLGISWIKDEIEDFALKQLNREAYQQIKDIVAEKRDERNLFLNKAQETIRTEALAAGIEIEVNARAKHFYSIYMKMRKRSKTAADIYDLFGIRILCNNIENCYILLGIIHRLWKPIEGRFKDYIAMPKSNGYQSLHTTVIAVPPAFANANAEADTAADEGKLLEIQIRTREMHHVAENGIASHWLYKKGSPREIVRPLDISIVNRVKDWKQNAEVQQTDANALWLEDIKREILRDSIYLFTPQGKVIELPAGATPLDFAYHIHTAVGEHCAGAKANGAIIPLSSELQNTQVIEILTSQQAHPHLNWLRIVKTSKARSKIRLWLEQNDESIIIEKNVVAKTKTAPTGGRAETGNETPKTARETPALQRVIETPGAEILQVRVEDEKNMMIRFARCCHPVTGDAIIGYVSRGRGIIVHRKNCGNLVNIPDFEERKIETVWENASTVLVRRFKVEARLQSNLFSEIEGAVRKRSGHLIEGRLEETATNRLTGFFTMQLENLNDLKAVLKNIRSIPGILNIQPLN